MKVRQILVMDDKEIDLEQLSKEEQKQVEARLNAAALRQAGYELRRDEKIPRFLCKGYGIIMREFCINN